MPYVGRSTDKISNVEVLDNITFDGSSSYTLQKNSVNFTPSSANTLLVSIDGVVQAGNFTVSGSTIDFGTAVAGTSTCDFILHYGIGLITTPADGTVTTAKLGDSAVTTAKILDANVTLAKLASGVLPTNTPAFFAYLNADQTGIGDATSAKIQVNTEIYDTDNCYDNSTNYRFTPTVAGKYLFHAQATISSEADSNGVIFDLYVYKNGSITSQSTTNASNNYLRETTQNLNVIFDANGTTDYFEMYAYGNTNNSGTWTAKGFSGRYRTYFGSIQNYRIG
jgi:hypothetical protein